jgi:hypothetical protein
MTVTLEYYLDDSGERKLITLAVARQKVAEIEAALDRTALAPDYMVAGEARVSIGEQSVRLQASLRRWQERLFQLSDGVEGHPASRRIIPT